jgi:hypothetical protein
MRTGYRSLISQVSNIHYILWWDLPTLTYLGIYKLARALFLTALTKMNIGHITLY